MARVFESNSDLYAYLKRLRQILAEGGADVLAGTIDHAIACAGGNSTEFRSESRSALRAVYRSENSPLSQLEQRRLAQALSERFVYTVWFREPKLPPDDQDYEWPGCFIIESVDAASAQRWGDHLAERYARSNGQEKLWSSIEPVEGSELPGLDHLAIIPDGYEATDRELEKRR